MLLLLACGPRPPELVTLSFQAQAATISGTPFGLDDDSRGAVGTGTMTWDLRTEDAAWDDARRGDYTGDGGFTLDFEGRAFDGSGTVDVDIADLEPDTFRLADEGPLAIDGAPADGTSMWFAITQDEGTALEDDLLPRDFPTALLDPELPHTFSVDDPDGTLLFQLVEISQTGWPED